MKTEARKNGAETDEKMDSLAISAWAGDSKAAKALLLLIASRVDNGKPLPFYARQYLTPALRGIAENPKCAAQALRLNSRKGVPGFGDRKQWEVAFAVGNLKQTGCPLRTNRKGKGAYSQVAECHSVSEAYVEAAWKAISRYCKAGAMEEKTQGMNRDEFVP